MPGEISWDVGREEVHIISEIAARAVALAKRHGVAYPKMTAVMDLMACHANGCPLRLRDLLAADDGNFAHDVFGIRDHINRDTGALGDCFLPRFTRVEELEGAAREVKARRARRAA